MRNGPKEYSTLDTGFGSDGNSRIKRKTYGYIDPILLKRSPRKILEVIYGPKYTGKIEDLNINFLEKLIKSLSDFREFKKTIQVLNYEIYDLVKNDFLDVVVKLKRLDRIDKEDFQLINDKFGVTLNNIEEREKEFEVLNTEETYRQKVLNALQKQEDAIKPAELIRGNSKVKLKIRENETDEEYETLVQDFIEQTKDFIKLTTEYKLDKEKIKLIKYFKILIQCNPDYLYNNSMIDGNGCYSTSRELFDLIGIYMNIPEKTIEDFKEIAKENNINIDLFMRYIFSMHGSVNIEDRVILGLKKQIYKLNQELFKYKHTTNEDNK